MCNKGGLSAVRSVATKPHRAFSGGRAKRPDQAAADPAAVTGGTAPVQSAAQVGPSADRELERRGSIRRRRDALLGGGDPLQQRSLLSRLGGP